MNHWANAGSSALDRVHERPSPSRRNSSATRSGAGRPLAGPAAGGRCRPTQERSVSESQEVYGALVLSGFGRVGALSTARSVSLELSLRCSHRLRWTACQAGP